MSRSVLVELGWTAIFCGMKCVNLARRKECDSDGEPIANADSNFRIKTHPGGWRGVLHYVQDDPLFHAEADANANEFRQMLYPPSSDISALGRPAVAAVRSSE
jgi:hypothetical protein